METNAFFFNMLLEGRKQMQKKHYYFSGFLETIVYFTFVIKEWDGSHVAADF